MTTRANESTEEPGGGSTGSPAEKKVTICHVSGKKYVKQEVDLSTLEGHLGHGDYQLDTEDPNYPNCAARV